MNRKHFEALAKTLDATRPGGFDPDMTPGQLAALKQWNGMVHALATMCREQNSRFNRDQFLHAAGYWKSNKCLFPQELNLGVWEVGK
jgi:hypothetical protein